MAVIAAGLMLTACRDTAEEGKDCPPAQRATLSGYCVPRYVSLRSDKVYARKGPGADYPAQWVYRARGLPVQVVAETEDWRRVCDPDGYAVWVSRSMVVGRRMVQVLGPDPSPLRKAPRPDAVVVGLLTPRALAQLDRCEGAWCAVRVGGVKGWVASDHVWGAAATPQCR